MTVNFFRQNPLILGSHSEFACLERIDDTGFTRKLQPKSADFMSCIRNHRWKHMEFFFFFFFSSPWTEVHRLSHSISSVRVTPYGTIHIFI